MIVDEGNIGSAINNKILKFYDILYLDKSKHCKGGRYSKFTMFPNVGRIQWKWLTNHFMPRTCCMCVLIKFWR